MIYYNIGFQDGLLGLEPNPVGNIILYMAGYNKAKIEGVIR
jgi:hypothetical protein